MHDRLGGLGTSANALIAVGLALKQRATAVAHTPEIQARVSEVLDALEIAEALDEVPVPQAEQMLTNIRGDLLFGAQILADAPPGAGWTHDSAALLQVFGDVSAGFPKVLKRAIAPKLGGLSARLAGPEARFLDIGVGVAALSIAMVREWPDLRVLGIDPLGPALDLAEKNVRAAGCEGRIDLIQASAEDLSETGAFDLAWVPSAFIPAPILPACLARVAAAMRPGGWVLLARPHFGSDRLAQAVGRLRVSLWGGDPLTPDGADALLGRAGLIDAHGVEMPVGSPLTVAAARRA